MLKSDKNTSRKEKTNIPDYRCKISNKILANQIQQQVKRLSSVQFSWLVVSDSLQLHESQHARPPCPSPTPRVHPNPCPSSRWCHPAISSSVVPFSFCPQSFPESGSFPMSQLFTSGGQSIGVSVSTSVPPMNTQGWSPLLCLNGIYPWETRKVHIHKSLNVIYQISTVKVNIMIISIDGEKRIWQKSALFHDKTHNN